MNFISRKLFNLQLKNFVRVPLIKFRGSKLIEHHLHSHPPSHQPIQTHTPPVKNSISIVDNMRAVEASIRCRRELSVEEIETINSGVPLKIGNWQKIKLKSKK
jgi:hypothetical protein